MDVAHNKVYLKLVPRIDYTRMRGALRAPVSYAFGHTCLMQYQIIYIFVIFFFTSVTCCCM